MIKMSTEHLTARETTGTTVRDNTHFEAELIDFDNAHFQPFQLGALLPF